MTIVLDTNILLHIFANRLAEPEPKGPYSVSVITEMELLSYPTLDANEERRIRAFLLDVAVIELTADVRDAAIKVRRASNLKLPDAIIAGTAIALDVELLTTDRRLARTPGVRSRLMTTKS